MKNIADDFLKNAFQFPRNNALFINETYYSYSELLSSVFEIYQNLATQNIKYSRIGVYCTDDLITYSSILAISLYGAAYVPINSKYPVEKNKLIIDSSEIELIIHNSTHSLNFDFPNENILGIDGNVINFSKSINKGAFIQIVQQPLAYILYTSGTTGQPKGVGISKKNISSFFDFFKSENEQFDFNSKDRFIQVFELTFDVSVFSFFMPLSCGACCYVLPQKGIKFIEIVKMMTSHEITVAILVPTILQYLEKYIEQIEFPKLRYSLFCGDKLMNRVANKWHSKTKNAKLYNCYGPTETTIICTYYLWEPFINKEDLFFDVVTFGKNFNNVNSILINDKNQIVSDEGELCFCGDQIITSYINNSNSDKFIKYKGLIYYKTGDKVKINSFGNYLFLGRTDNQLKINGHRVDLIEVEEAINEILKTKFTIVPILDKNELTQLVIFIEGKSEQGTNLNQLLAEKLPNYMLPQKIIFVEHIPLNINNKYDLLELKSIYMKEINSNN